MMILGVVGGIISAVGAIAQANAQAAAAKYNQQVNERNAKIAMQQGAAQAESQQRQGAIALGKLRAAYGDAGLAFEGDALTVFQDSATQAELDVRRVRYNAQLRSQGYQDQAVLNKMEAKAATTAGILGAAGAIVGAGRSILQAA